MLGFQPLSSAPLSSISPSDGPLYVTPPIGANPVALMGIGPVAAVSSMGVIAPTTSTGG